MSNQANHNNESDKLKALLDKANTADNLPLDDFEKDAMEGFALISDKEDVFELKHSLDKRMYEEVLKKTEKRETKVYWYAAAGLFLIIGFSIYFLRNNLFGPTDKNLAVHVAKTEPPKEVNAPISEEEKESLKPNNTAYGSKGNVVTRIKNDLNKEKKAQEDVKTPQMPQADALAQKAGVSNLDNEAPSASSQKAISAAPVMASNRSEPKFSKVETVLLGEQAPEQQHSDELAAIAMSEKEEKHEKNKSLTKKAEAFTEQKSVMASKASASEFNTVSNCYYTGGDAALNEELKQKLILKELNFSFEAILFINEKKKVENVKFTNAFSLTSEQQKQIIELLKTLDKFNFKLKLKETELFEYRIVFRP